MHATKARVSNFLDMDIEEWYLRRHVSKHLFRSGNHQTQQPHFANTKISLSAPYIHIPSDWLTYRVTSIWIPVIP